MHLKTPLLRRVEEIRTCGLHVQDSDVLTEALKEFADEFPQLMRPLIEERDEYMVFLLRTLATRCSPSLKEGLTHSCQDMWLTSSCQSYCQLV